MAHIVNTSDNTEVSGTFASDSLENSGLNVTIYGYDGDDTIRNDSYCVTIVGGNGNNHIYDEGGDALITVGAGNNTILASYGIDTIIAGSGNDSIEVVQGGNGLFIDSGDGDDEIGVLGNFIIRSGNATVKAGAGNDTVSNLGYLEFIIEGGDGDDYIEDFKVNDSTINAGTGNDSIMLGTNEFEPDSPAKSFVIYAEGDGNDTISSYYGYPEGDVIQISSTSTPNSVVSGNDVVINVGLGSMRLVDAVDKTINVIDINGNEIHLSGGNSNTADSSILKKSDNTYIYTGGDKIISDYSTHNVINFGALCVGFGVNGNDFILNSAEGSLTIQNSKDKWIDLALADGNIIARGYLTNNDGVIDGRNFHEWELLVGGDNASNTIYAGSGGSSLWGGSGGNDTLVGGEGYDEFVYKIGSGNDVIQGASSSDVVNLEGITVSQIASINTSATEVSAKFTDGGSLKIQGTAEVDIKVDGWTVAFNHSSNTWSTK